MEKQDLRSRSNIQKQDLEARSRLPAYSSIAALMGVHQRWRGEWEKRGNGKTLPLPHYWSNSFPKTRECVVQVPSQPKVGR